jgi:hypothetical protein
MLVTPVSIIPPILHTKVTYVVEYKKPVSQLWCLRQTGFYTYVCDVISVCCKLCGCHRFVSFCGAVRNSYRPAIFTLLLCVRCCLVLSHCVYLSYYSFLTPDLVFVFHSCIGCCVSHVSVLSGMLCCNAGSYCAV